MPRLPDSVNWNAVNAAILAPCLSRRGPTTSPAQSRPLSRNHNPNSLYGKGCGGINVGGAMLVPHLASFGATGCQPQQIGGHDFEIHLLNIAELCRSKVYARWIHVCMNIHYHNMYAFASTCP